MNEILDPKLPAEELNAEVSNLLETSDKKEVEKEVVKVEDAVTEEIAVPEEVTTPEKIVATEEVSVPEEVAATEEIPAPEEKQPEASENETTEELSEPEEVSATVVEVPEKLTKPDIIERLQTLVDGEVDTVKNEVEALKHAFYKLKKAETEEAKKIFLEGGGEEADFQPANDESEEQVKVLLNKFKERKAAILAQEESLKEANLTEKKAILEELKALIDSKDDFNKVYNEFRRLQQQWKDIKLIPQSAVNDLWKEYQHYSEIFYDLLKINNEMREYDFRKNLELKTALCEAVERLDAESDVVSAFHQLQKLHQEWREIGPVSRELREEIWTRFKTASSVINKKHQSFFETLRAGEQENLDAKTAICEQIEAVNYEELKTFKDWDDKNKFVLDLQQQWKNIGFAPKKFNVVIFERFRAACDVFFQKKSEFYKSIKDSMEENLEKKKALCEKAEALKDSTDWKETTDKMIALQKEWKSVGTVSRKYSDAIWSRFISACDYFFEQKNKNFASQKTEEQENLRLKKEVIEKIKNIDESLGGDETIELIRELMKEWNNIGFVPFKDKDKIHKEYRTAVDSHFDRLKVDQAERRLQSFKSNISEMAGSEKPKGKLLGERERLMRTFEKLKSDIQTYENNIGFLSVSSKGGSGLVKEMTRKIEDLKQELDLIVKKIQAIDDNLEG